MFYPDVWNEFVRLPRCLGAQRRDYPEWHRGRPRYYVWAVDAETAPVDARLRRARAALDGRLVAPYARHAHITVAVCGFLTDAALHDDDVTAERLEAEARRLEALAARPFTVGVGGANSFASAPFLEVADPDGALARLRDAVLDGGGEYRTTPYVPHVTIGIYDGPHLTAEIAPRLGRRDDDAIALTVSGIALYSYAAASLGSPLQLERAIPFSRPARPA